MISHVALLQGTEKKADRQVRPTGNAFRKFKLAGNRWEDATPLGQVIVGAFTQGSSFVATLG